MKKLFFIVLSLWFFSCGKQEPRAETETVPPHHDSLSLTTQDADTLPLAPFPETALPFREKAEQLSLYYTTHYPDTVQKRIRFFPERFQSEVAWWSVAAWQTEGRVTGLFFATYPDSAATANVVHNWWNCFGAGCESLKSGETTRITASDRAALILYNDTTLVCLDYPCVLPDSLISHWKKEVKQLFYTPTHISLDSDCKGRLTWLLSK